MRTHRDRHPLTYRYAHEVRDTVADPHDWWEGPVEPPSRIVGPVERGLDWIDRRWPLWFALATVIGSALGLMARLGWL